MHGGGMFIQLLEGADDQVFRLYVKLLDDPRHANCRIIFVTPIKKRLFAEWAMAAMTVPDSAFREIEEILAQSYETIEAKLLDKVMKLFMRG
jgi:hypothetical protein